MYRQCCLNVLSKKCPFFLVLSFFIFPLLVLKLIMTIDSVLLSLCVIVFIYCITLTCLSMSFAACVWMWLCECKGHVGRLGLGLKC